MVGPVSFSVPKTWLPAPTQAAAGVEEMALRAPAPQGMSASVALAQFQLKPARGAAAEADSLLRIKRDVQRATNARTESRVVPGFGMVMLVSYDQPGEAGELVHTETLIGDVTGGGLFVLTVKRSQKGFASESLPAIARSVSGSGG